MRSCCFGLRSDGSCHYRTGEKENGGCQTVATLGDFTFAEEFKMGCAETSLVLQWLRTHLSIQGTQNQMLIGGTKFPHAGNQLSLGAITREAHELP